MTNWEKNSNLIARAMKAYTSDPGFEELYKSVLTEFLNANDENKQLKSLLSRIHVATDQFYQKKQCNKPDKTPYQDIVDRYHSILPDLPRIEKLTTKRMASMRRRWKEDLSTLGDWEAYFKDASRKRFLFGKNDREWVANFDFFLREQTITYMQEGKYDG
jgi:hypothetical protein